LIAAGSRSAICKNGYKVFTLAKTHAAPQHETQHENVQLSPPASDSSNPLSSKVATVAVVGLGVALIEAELIPGMLIGVAAMLAPNLVPRIGNALRPMLKGMVRAGYTIAQRTKETVSEASEQMQDIIAEVRSEKGEPVNAPGKEPV
jgi:hypothetical protein